MIKQLYLVLLATLTAGIAFSQSPLNSVVHFPVNVATLDASAVAALENDLKSLENPYPCYLVEVVGHTDADGDLVFNQSLSQRRAQSVRAWLLEKGVPESSISMGAEGELRPLASNDSERGKASNRRVELRFRPHPAGCPQPFDFDVSFFEFESDADKGFSFTYPPSGTKVNIPPGAVLGENGKKVSGRIVWRYREWRNQVEFLVSNINMEYPGRRSGNHFRSGGMFELRAFRDGVELQLDPGKTLQIDFVLTDSSRQYALYAYNDETETWYGPNENPFGNGRIMGGSPRVVETCVDTVNFGLGVDTVQTFIALLDTGLAMLNQPRQNPKDKSGRKAKFEKCWSSRLYAGLDYVGDLNRGAAEELKGISLEVGDSANGLGLFPLQIMDELGKNPELQALAQAKIYLDAGTRKKYARSVLKGKFTDLRVKWRSRKNAVLELKSYGRLQKLPVVIHDRRKSRPDKKVKARQAYHRQLQERKKAYENQLPVPFTNRFWNYSKVLMVDEEKCMTEKEWKEHFSTRRGAMRKRYAQARAIYASNPDSARAKIDSFLLSRQNSPFSNDPWGSYVATRGDTVTGQFIQELSLSGLGIWNCDQIARMKDPITLRPTFVKENGDEIEMNTVSVIDPDINGVFLFSFRYGLNSISMERNSKSVLVGIDMEGKKHFLGAEGTQGLGQVDPDAVRLTMKPIPDEVNSVEELGAFLGFPVGQIGMR